MLKKISVMAKRCDELADKLKNWYNSLDSLLLAFLVLAIVICLLIFVATILFTIFGLIMLYLPRLCTLLIITCISVPLGVLVIGLSLKRISAGLWFMGTALSILSLIISVGLGFFDGQNFLPKSVCARIFSNQTQFPIGDPRGLAVDNEGRIYIAIHSYSRVQVYSNEGEFITGWFIEAGGGSFYIWLEDNNHLHVVTSRTDRHDVFNLSGILLKSPKVTSNEENRLLFIKAGGISEQDIFGNNYAIESPEWFPKVRKVTVNGEESVVIKDPYYFWLAKAPQPILIVGLIGLIMTVIFVKIIKKKVDLVSS